MDSQALLYVMAAAVAVSAIAIVLQMLILYGLYRSARAMREQVTRLTPKAEAALESAQTTMEQTRTQVRETTAKAGEVLDLTRSQLVRVNEVLVDATTRAKSQLQRVELVMDDSISRLHETVVLIHDGVLKPLRQISGIAAGVRAALAQFGRGGRPTVAQATHDDEMFI